MKKTQFEYLGEILEALRNLSGRDLYQLKEGLIAEPYILDAFFAIMIGAQNLFKFMQSLQGTAGGDDS